MVVVRITCGKRMVAEKAVVVGWSETRGVLLGGVLLVGVCEVPAWDW